ncbi:RICIN domain-containing protein, partial [Kitasatospora sp. NPDC059722]|uniref:RICIN domain-containing protein n=1 Tax=Kitasatospora sp. NPDC059722 TaxID=3346925 RepID=UPI0036818B5A
MPSAITTGLRALAVLSITTAVVSAIPGVATAAPADWNGTHQIKTFADGHCLDVWGAGVNDGAGIDQWTCTSGNNQQFTIVPLDNNKVQIKTFAGKCLDVWGADVNDGAGIDQWTCTSGNNQQFTIVPLDNNKVQ